MVAPCASQKWPMERRREGGRERERDRSVVRCDVCGLEVYVVQRGRGREEETAKGSHFSCISDTNRTQERKTGQGAIYIDGVMIY
eukprot:766113-Hanusia_phi.AAC.1